MLFVGTKGGNMIGLIGHTGVIGKHILTQNRVDRMYNSTNIDQIAGCSVDTLYCAAPSGNRLLANNNPDQDLESVKSLITALRKVDVNNFVLISTVDTVHARHTAYGRHRKLLEEFVQTTFKKHCIARLPTLISAGIRKNVLYDLKHNQYTDSINLGMQCHWYPLVRLRSDINVMIDNNITEENFISEPIANRDIVQTFFPKLLDQITATPTNTGSYNLTCNNTAVFGKYIVGRQEIFDAFTEYLT